MDGTKYFSSPLNHQDICPWLLHLRRSLRASRSSWNAGLSEVSVPDILRSNSPLHSLDSCYGGLQRNSVLRPTPDSFAPFLCLAAPPKSLLLNLSSPGHLAPILRRMGLIAQTQRHMSARPLSRLFPFIQDFQSQIWEGAQLVRAWHKVPIVFPFPGVSFNAPFSEGNRETI